MLLVPCTFFTPPRKPFSKIGFFISQVVRFYTLRHTHTPTYTSSLLFIPHQYIFPADTGHISAEVNHACGSLPLRHHRELAAGGSDRFPCQAVSPEHFRPVGVCVCVCVGNVKQISRSKVAFPFGKLHAADAKIMFSCISAFRHFRRTGV